MARDPNFTVRIPLAIRESVDELAREQRMRTGDEYSAADFVREAIAEAVARRRGPEAPKKVGRRA